MLNLNFFRQTIKQHPLRVTVALSLMVHLAVLVYFQSWELIPNRTKETPKNTIRIKAIQKPERVKPMKKPIFREKKIPHIKSPEKRQPVLKFQEVRDKAPLIKSAAIKRPQYRQMQSKTAESNFKTEFNFQPAVKSRKHAAIHHSNRVPLKAQKIQFSTNVSPTALLARTQKNFPKSISLAARKPAESIVATQVQKTPVQRTTHAFQTTQSLEKVKARQSKNVFAHGELSAQPATALVSGPKRLKAAEVVHSVQAKELRSLTSVFANTTVSEKKSDSIISMHEAEGITARPLKNFPAEGKVELKSASTVAPETSISRLPHSTPMQMASIPADFSDILPGTDQGSASDSQEASPNSSPNFQKDSQDYLGAARKEFSSRVWNRIAQFKHYPRIARRRGFEGQPVVAFTIGHDGKLLEFSVDQPSPFKLLDQAALEAVQAASPYPSIPKSLNLQSMQFKLPVSFILEEP